MTHYVTVFEKQAPETLKQAVWKPWIHAKDRDDLIGLVVSRHLRERGGLRLDQRLDLFVYDRTTMSYPCVVNMTHLVATKK